MTLIHFLLNNFSEASLSSLCLSQDIFAELLKKGRFCIELFAVQRFDEISDSPYKIIR